MSSLINEINNVSDKLIAINEYIFNLPGHKDIRTKIKKTLNGYYSIQSVLDTNEITVTITQAELIKACKDCSNSNVSETIDKYISDRLFDEYLEKVCK